MFDGSRGAKQNTNKNSWRPLLLICADARVHFEFFRMSGSNSATRRAQWSIANYGHLSTSIIARPLNKLAGIIVNSSLAVANLFVRVGDVTKCHVQYMTFS